MRKEGLSLGNPTIWTIIEIVLTAALDIISKTKD